MSHRGGQTMAPDSDPRQVVHSVCKEFTRKLGARFYLNDLPEYQISIVYVVQ